VQPRMHCRSQRIRSRALSCQVTATDLKAHNAHSFAWVPPFHSIFQLQHNGGSPFNVVPPENRAHGGFLCVQPIPSHDSAYRETRLTTVRCAMPARYWMGDEDARAGLLYFGVEKRRVKPKSATEFEERRLEATKIARDLCPHCQSPPLKTCVVVVDMQNDYSKSSESEETRCAQPAVQAVAPLTPVRWTAVSVACACFA
jgi:hypothetical protein